MAYVLILEHSFVKVLERMSMINFINYSLSTAAEGFVLSHAPLKNNKNLNSFQSTQTRRGKNRSESQGLTPSSWVRACGTRRGSWGRASILSVRPNVAPDSEGILTTHSLRSLLVAQQTRAIFTVSKFCVEVQIPLIP